MTKGLLRYDAACRAVAKAKAVDEAKEIRDRAEAMRAYAKQAKNREMEADAAEIRIRAERRVGELIEKQRETVGLSRGGGEPGVGRRGKNAGSELTRISLPEAGIDKNLADRARKLARLPDEEFHSRLEDWRRRASQKDERIIPTLTHVSHNSGEDDWYTPAPFIESAREVLGEIDCDPASSARANKIVKARVFYDEKHDGLTQKTWGARVWLNPPYASGLVEDFARMLLQRYDDGEVKAACLLTNNATETKWAQSFLASAAAVCFVSGRIKYLDSTGTPAKTPLQGQMVIYLGSKPERFAEVFKIHGVVYAPSL